MRNPYYLIPYDVREALNPRQWMRELKWKRQRVSRGWSDRDAWGAGDHIAKMTAEILQHLQDHGTCSWPDWFRLNVKEEGRATYKNLQQVIDDINNFLEFTETTWADGCTAASSLEESLGEADENGAREYKGTKWVDNKTGKVLTEAQTKLLMNQWHKKWERLYKKAQKAMQFFGRHFTQFWD